MVYDVGCWKCSHCVLHCLFADDRCDLFRCLDNVFSVVFVLFLNSWNSRHSEHPCTGLPLLRRSILRTVSPVASKLLWFQRAMLSTRVGSAAVGWDALDWADITKVPYNYIHRLTCTNQIITTKPVFDSSWKICTLLPWIGLFFDITEIEIVLILLCTHALGWIGLGRVFFTFQWFGLGQVWQLMGWVGLSQRRWTDVLRWPSSRLSHDNPEFWRNVPGKYV